MKLRRFALIHQWEINFSLFIRDPWKLYQHIYLEKSSENIVNWLFQKGSCLFWEPENGELDFMACIQEPRWPRGSSSSDAGERQPLLWVAFQFSLPARVPSPFLSFKYNLAKAILVHEGWGTSFCLDKRWKESLSQLLGLYMPQAGHISWLFGASM